MSLHLDRLSAAKSAALRDMVDFVKIESPLYSDKLKAIDPTALQSITDIGLLPFTERGDLRRGSSFPALCRSARPEAIYQSSGTSGSSICGFPDLSAEKAKSFGLFLDQWMGLTKSRIRRAMVALAYEMNPTGIRFQMALPYAGVTVVPVGVRTTIFPPESTIRAIDELRPGALFSRPFELLRYADIIASRDSSPFADTSVEKIFFLGEVVSDSKWERMAQVWDDADIYGHYGLTELDAGLLTCSGKRYHEPDSPHLHTELVDPHTLLDTADGQWGELVFSVLKRGHAPLLRYRTGDIARRYTSACSCGSGTASYSIMGRAADAYIAPHRTIYPIEIENLILGHPDIGNEYTFIITPANALHLRLERSLQSTRDLTPLQCEVVDKLHETFMLPISVEVVPFGRLADKHGLPKKKSGRFTDLRGLSDAAAQRELEVNVVDGRHLKVGNGDALSI